MPAYLMNANIAALLYLVAGVLFILALRGLSSPASSRQGNAFGMLGMAIAIGTTLSQLAAPDELVTQVLIIVARSEEHTSELPVTLESRMPSSA